MEFFSYCYIKINPFSAKFDFSSSKFQLWEEKKKKKKKNGDFF